jgi:hypothetical protein
MSGLRDKIADRLETSEVAATKTIVVIQGMADMQPFSDLWLIGI